MKPFINRVREVAYLDRILASAKAELVLLYGRRRVGKTALLRHVAGRSEFPVLYHVAAQTTRTDELNRFSLRLAESFRDEVVRTQPFSNWESVWLYLAQKAEAKPFGLMLDEFSYAVEGDPALPSLLQHTWDQRLQHTGIKLVLCGSSISMMERLGLSESSPLYGRRTGQWRLEPFGPDEFGLLWPGRNLADTLAAYCVAGGTPQYIGLFDRNRSLLDNIRDQALSKGSALYDEVSFLLREELRDPRVYQAIMAVVAGGARKFSELSSKTGLDKAHLTRYLAVLADLGLMEREVPVTEPQPEKSRRGLYRIRDPFVSFWYRFVFPNRDRLELGETDGFLKQAVAPALDDYTARVVAPYVGALFRTRWRRHIPFEPAFAGRYWDEHRELDWLVLDHDRKQATAVEVKWTRSPVNAGSVAAELASKVAAVPALRECRVKRILVSRAGFRGDARVAGCALIALNAEI